MTTSSELRAAVAALRAPHDGQRGATPGRQKRSAGRVGRTAPVSDALDPGTGAVVPGLALGLAILFVSVASAADAPKLPSSLYPVLAPIDAPKQYEEFAASQGRSGETLACDEMWRDQALLCFKTVDHGKRHWVTSADLAKWHTDVATLRSTVTAEAKDKLQLQTVELKGEKDTYTYWLSAPGDGWAAAGLLVPNVLGDQVGMVDYAVAAPTEGVVLVWKPGTPELDRMIAVGVKEMYEQKEGPVTPVVHQWTGVRWAAFAEAVPSKPPADGGK